MLILITPKGWTGPKEVDGLPTEGSFRSHQVPLSELAEKPEHLKLLEAWMRATTQKSFSMRTDGSWPKLAELAPSGQLRMSANPHANGGLLLRDLDLPDFRSYAVEVDKPATTFTEATKVLGSFLRDILSLNEETRNFRVFGPDETASNRLSAVFEVDDRELNATILPTDDHLSPDGRVMEVLSEHMCQGWLEGYLLTGRHGLFNCYEAFIHIVDSMFNQHAKWLKTTRRIPWRRPNSESELPAVEPRVAAGPQRAIPPGSRLHRPCDEQKAEIIRVVPSARCQHVAVGCRPLPAQSQLRQRDRRGQAAGAQLPLDGRSDRALYARHRHLGVGEQRLQ